VFEDIKQQNKADLVEAIFISDKLDATKSMQDFTNTLHILASGWTSSHKEEAHISTVDRISWDQHELAEALRKWLKAKDPKRNENKVGSYDILTHDAYCIGR